MTERPAESLAPSRFERILAIAALLLLAAILTALVRGAADWHRIPWIVWAHLLTVVVAVVLTPVMLLRRRGDSTHRLLGRVWAAAMIATAAFSLGVREINHGQFSWIHALSIFTLVQVPLLWWAARKHRVAAHRMAVRGMVTGALAIAGSFTLLPGRMLGHWLFG